MLRILTLHIGGPAFNLIDQNDQQMFNPLSEHWLIDHVPNK